MPDWFGDRVFGGVIVAEVLSAALQTVDDEVRPHSLHGYFLRPALAGPPVELQVERLRDGRSFRTRQVEMRQGDKAVCAMGVSFHADEPGDEYQLPMDGVPEPEDVPPVDDGPGPFHIRDVGPTPREPDGTFRSTRRAWCRCALRLPDDPALHVRGRVPLRHDRDVLPAPQPR